MYMYYSSFKVNIIDNLKKKLRKTKRKQHKQFTIRTNYFNLIINYNITYNKQ